MSYIVLLVVLSAVTYRVSRFIVLDSLIDEPRNWVLSWLEMHPNGLTNKLHELLGCPWCVTIWIAAGVVAIQDQLIDGMPVPIWAWLAAATGSLVFWGIIDNE